MNAKPESPRIVLFGDRLSPFVEKVARVLAYKRLPYETVAPRSPSDFRKWNPLTGKMPVLELEGRRIIDSSAIARELDRLEPEPAIFASDRATALRQRLLEDWSDESLYFHVLAQRWVPENEAATRAQLLQALGIPSVLHFVVGPILRHQISAIPQAQGLGRLTLPLLLDEMELRLEELEVQLGDRPYFFADQPSIADLALFGQFETLGSGPTPQGQACFERHSKLVAWQERVRQATT